MSSATYRCAVGLLMLCGAASGCQPKLGPGEHECDCVCYLEEGNNVHRESQTVNSTQECGNVNGTACSGGSGQYQYNGQLANCDPNPNVARPKPWVPRPPDNQEAHQ
jgi:hypothetical protein